MYKKIITLCMGILLSATLWAQGNNQAHGHGENLGLKNITFSADDVQFWCGTGSNQCVVIVAWDDSTPATALAWGVRWNGTALAINILDSIMAYDTRFSHNYSPDWMSDVEYHDDNLNLSSTINYWCYSLASVSGWAGTYGTQIVANNDVMELSASCNYTMTTAVAATNPNADTTTAAEATIAASDIQYWLGSGSNEAILAVNWAQPDTCLAWGFRFSSETVTVKDIMDTLALYDSRFSYAAGLWGVDDIYFINGNDTLRLVELADDFNYWLYNVNGSTAQLGYDVQTISNGDFVKWGDASIATVLSYDDWGYPTSQVWTTPVTAVSPIAAPGPTEATIAASDIQYWLGSGSNEAILAVNWAQPDTCLAWGFRFSAETVTVKDIMDTLALYDPRFDYAAGNWGVDDIYFINGNDTLRLVNIADDFNYWLYNVNGSTAQLGYDVQTVSNGDFVKWGDASIATILSYDNWGYPDSQVWTTPVTAVSEPNTEEPEHGPFCGPVGTEGCSAIQYSDSQFIAWATTCTIERGYTNIADPTTLVSYGNESEAVGPVTNSNLNVVSLGDGGMATLSFNHPITNGEGYDFAVFENSFDNYFLELAFVEVSSDGEHFVRFPATSLTPTDHQIGPNDTVDATYINNLAGKYRSGWGTPFDLEELRDSANLNIDSITYVRIIDVVGSINPQYGSYDAFGHLVNDPYPTDSYSGGFDLDGIGVIHQLESTQSIADIEGIQILLYPNPASCQVTCQVHGEGYHRLELYDITGRQLLTHLFEGESHTLSTASLPSGIYMIRLDGQTQRLNIRH